MKIEELIKQAEECITFREHQLNEHWLLYASPNRLIANNRCKVCKMEVQVNTNPLPNQIDIGGEAVALTCERE